MAVHPIPYGFHSVTPYLIVQRAAKLIEFLDQAFGAEKIFSMLRPDGTIMHAQIRIGDSMIEISDATAEMPAMPAMLHLYVADADATYVRAIQAGATSLMEPTDQFYGDRESGVKDPCGNQWYIATHKEDVSPEELANRQQALMKERG